MAWAVPQPSPCLRVMHQHLASCLGRQELRCCQLSLPWASPALSSASAMTRMSRNLPVPPLQVPWLRDMVVSRVAVLASLTFSGRVIVFPK